MNSYTIIDEKSGDLSFIRLNRRKGNANATLHLMRFKEGDFHIAYLPEIKISAYGDTEKEAIEMLLDTVREYLTKLVNMSTKEMEGELAKYGFFHGTMVRKNFEYKGPYVDIKGVLREFNLPEDTSVEVSELVANG